MKSYWEGTLERRMEKIRKSKILEANKETALQLNKELETVDNIKPGRRYHYMLLLNWLGLHLKDKPYKEATKQDIIDFLDKLKHKRFATKGNAGRNKSCKTLFDSSLEQYKIMLKAIYNRLFEMRKGEYPECVSSIKTGNNNHRELPAENLLTVEEINKMVSVACNPRDKCLVKLLYESAFRIEELLSLKIKHVKFIDGNEAEIKATGRNGGKTGERIVPIILSVPELKVWMNSHPDRDNPEAYLFVNLYKKGYKEDMSAVTANSLLKRLAQEAGIKKRVYPHLLRHSRATWLYQNGMNERELKMFIGHSKNSRATDIYVNISQKEVKSKIRQLSGKEEIKVEPQNIQYSEECPNSECKQHNPVGTSICFNCNTLLKGNVDRVRETQQLTELLNKMKKLEPVIDKLMKSGMLDKI